MKDRLLKLGEAAEKVGLKNAATFSRFARRHGIAVVRFGNKVVRVRETDLERAISAHCESRPARTDCGESG